MLAAVDIHGVCPGCGDQRILPGRGPDGAPICPACAGIVHSAFRCRRCQSEGRLYHRKLCVHCTITDRVTALLDNGTGHTDPALAPLAAALATGPTPTPAGRLVWLARPHNRKLLRALATGQAPLTHPGLTAYPDQAGVPYLRALLVHCGALPDLDRQLLDFEAWLTRRLHGLTEHPHERLLRQFGLWHQLPRMRTKAARQPLTPPAQTYAQLEFIHATAFCTWLAEHVHRPTELGQDDLDRYYTALKIGHRQALRGFLNWAMTSHNLPSLTFTRPRFATGEALTQTRRIDLLRRLITDPDGDGDGDDRPLRMRVAACVLLLYAQPVTRIMTLTIDDIAVDDDGMTLKLGDPPAPVPEPFAALVLACSPSYPPAAAPAGCSPAGGPASRSATSPSAKASAISESRSGTPASPPSASSRYKHPPRLSPKHSGSTTPPPTARPSTPAGSGTATPPPTRPRREPSREHAANEYAAPPVAGGTAGHGREQPRRAAETATNWR